jgi:hypothetical protein
VAVNGLMEELELGRGMFMPQAALAAWPMPYRGGKLTVSFAVNGRLGAATGTAEVGLFDLAGRLVTVVARGEFTGGQQFVYWDGRDSKGDRVASGLYFLQSRSGSEKTRIKVVVAR